MPSAIAGPAVVCGFTTANYSVPPVPEATTYIWTVPSGAAGMTITSGQGTTMIHVTFTAAITPGIVSVVAVNSCGTSAAHTLYVTRKPSVPGVLIGPTSTCGLPTAAYSVAPVFGATSYTWTIPTGMTITSGTGTNSIIVSISPGFTVGNIKVTATNACGSTAGANTLIIGSVPGTPGILSGTTNVCGLTTATYSIPAVAYASGYTWTVPSWMSITSGAGTTSITVSAIGAPAVGTLSVAATNVCGTGSARTISLTIASILPGTITGPATLCGSSTASYSVPSLGAGYTYNWTLAMTGWTITSGAGTTAITCSGPPSGASATGLVKVTSTNTCGNISGVRSKSVSYCHSAIGNSGNQDANTNTFSSIYPNPAFTEFIIDMNSDSDKEITLEVYDVLGNLLIKEKHQITEGVNSLKTDIEKYHNGMYFVRLVDTNSNSIYTQRVIKQ